MYNKFRARTCTHVRAQNPFNILSYIYETSMRTAFDLQRSSGYGIVVEWLALLPLCILFTVSSPFCARLAGRDGVDEAIRSWKVLVLLFPSKECVPAGLDEYRGVNLIDVVSKW